MLSMTQTSETRPVRGVMFDLDGTLADTLDDITDSLNAAFDACGYAPLTSGKARQLIGAGLSTLLQRASNETDAQRLDELVHRYREEYRRRLMERTRLYDGIPDLLDTLTARNTIMAVLSNKPDEFTAPICSALLGRWSFVRFQGSLPDTPRKPDPTLALQLCKDMGLAPGDVVFVGDSDADVDTARNAGMIAVGVTWGFRDRAHLVAAAPDVVVETPAALIDWCQRYPFATGYC